MDRMRTRVQNGYWVFQASLACRYQQVSGRGKMLKRQEPVASVICEALEGYASGRFETQAEVMRFLQDHPLFPRTAPGWSVTSASGVCSGSAPMRAMLKRPIGASRAASASTNRLSAFRRSSASGTG